MKPELIVHIGRPKVGSTALQGFLNQNRNALLERGVCYPKTGLYHGASHKFSLVFLPGLPDYPVVKDVNPKALYADLAEEIRRSGASRAVISSEHFWLVKPTDPAALLKRDFDVRILVYLRRQDDVLVSSYVQEVRGGTQSLDRSMDAYLEDPGRLKLLDYDAVLGSWEKAFGRDRIQVRLYEAIAPGQGIEADFLSALGLNAGGGFKFGSGRKNTSPSLDLLRLLEEARRFPVGELSHRQLSGILTEVSAALEGDERFEPSRLISDEQRRRVLDFFADSNARLFSRYDCDGARFPEFVASGVDRSGLPEVELDRIQRALLGVVAYQQRQIQILISRVNHLERGASGSLSVPAVPPSSRTTRGLLAGLLRLLRLR